MNIKDQWNRLKPATQQWLIEHPGSQILPRTITAMICSETGGTVVPGRHGETVLSQEDREFISAKANETRPGAPLHSSAGTVQP